MKTISILSAVLSLSILGCSAGNVRVATKVNEGASLAGELPSNPLQGKVITSWVDPKASTMSTLFGNDVAVQYARTNAKAAYPTGSVVSLVTWNQEEDARWFGGRIPASPRSVEFVRVGAAPDHRASYSYERFEGAPLKKVATEEGVAPNERAAYLLSQRAAVMP
jgi:hypothetical protein